MKKNDNHPWQATSQQNAACLGLEHFDQLELATTLELKALELGQRAVWVEHRIALLDQLALLLAGWQDHGLHVRNTLDGLYIKTLAM